MEKNEAQEEHMIKEENICHVYCIEKTRRNTKNENEVNILRQIYLVGEKKNREAKGEEERRKKGEKYFEKKNIWSAEKKKNRGGKKENSWRRKINAEST